jgi:hypothetical protein
MSTVTTTSVATPISPPRYTVTRTYKGGVTGGSFLIAGLLVLWTLALMAQLYIVHMQVVFTNSGHGYVLPSQISYYNKPSYATPGHVALRTSQTEVDSFAWFIYASDLLCVFAVAYIPAALLVAVVCRLSIWLTGEPIFIFILFVIELAKSIFFTVIWLNKTQCSEYPFCVNRSTSSDFVHTDYTFIVEAVGNYVSTVMLAIIGIASFFVYAGRRYTDQPLLAGKKFGERSSSGQSVDLVVQGPVNGERNGPVSRGKKNAVVEVRAPRHSRLHQV